MALKYSTAHRNSVGTSLVTDVGNAGVLNIYTGTRPASVGTALSGNTLLAALTCGSPFGVNASGVVTANAIASNTAVATGTATFFRLTTSGGTAVIDGDAAATASDLNLNGGPGITSGQTVGVSSFVVTTFGA